MDRVLVFDTTLRDGEQSPGVAFSIDNKLAIAAQLEKLGVDIIEAGFPATSLGDFAAVEAVSRLVKDAQVAGLARAVRSDIDAAAEALRHALQSRIHIFLSTSDIHLMHQLAKDRGQVREMARSAVAYARSRCADVEFSPMDATRSDMAYVYSLLEEVIDAGATTLNIPDTVGYTTPEEFARTIRGIFENVSNVHKARVSVHCHDDLGMAVANSLAAVKAGARQVECCINGIGERAGNAALEEIAMAMRVRRDFYQVETGIDPNEIYCTSKLVSELSGMAVQPNKAIVGSNAFRHQSGIHQDGILKMRETYEIMDSREIGWPAGAEIVLGKLSGRHGFRARIDHLGIRVADPDFERAFTAFKDLADRKAEVSDAEINGLIRGQEEKDATVPMRWYTSM
jgi:2-isopropylmalate synthase